MADINTKQPGSGGKTPERKERQDVGPGPRIRARAEQRFSRLADDRSGLVLHPAGKKPHIESFRAWRALRTAAAARGARPSGPSAPGAPGAPPSPPPAPNWIPIGPSAVRRGQTTGFPAVSGRAVDIAIAPGASVVYVATANGGVWSSTN